LSWYAEPSYKRQEIAFARWFCFAVTLDLFNFVQNLKSMIATLPEVSERLFTVREWLDFEKTAEQRHEFYFGKLILTAGEAKRANIIAGNIKKVVDDPL